MTREELNERVQVEWIGTCQYRVTINYYGREFNCISNNSEAWDAIDDRCDGVRQYTFKQALYAFYKECIYKNRDKLKTRK